MSALLPQLEVVLTTLAIIGMLFTAASFAYSYFFGKLSTAIKTFEKIEDDTEYTKRKTNELANSVEKQGDILLALAKAHDNPSTDEEVNVESDKIEEELGREPRYSQYVTKED